MKLETKSATVGAQVLDADDTAGEVTFLASVTGVLDEVGDVIEPGAFAESLRRRRPEFLMGHTQGRTIGDVVHVEELAPGDRRLPATLPAGAGGLLVKARYNLSTSDGREAYEAAKFYGPETAYSIGYVPHQPEKKTWRGRLARLISRLDLFEVSQVLVGANSLARALSVKSGQPGGLEFKSNAVALGASGAATISDTEMELAQIEIAMAIEECKDAVHGHDVLEDAILAEHEFVMVGSELRAALCAKCCAPAGPSVGGQLFGDEFRCSACAAGSGWAA
jgi:HK97 family phage prohead protease